MQAFGLQEERDSMINGILLVSVVILCCVFAEKASDRFGMPALLLFMFIGMLFGSDGIFKIPFDNFALAENICSIALIFIMFYGGFNTKWKLAKEVAVKSVLLSTLGVVITACVTAFLCCVLLHFSPEESFLIGAVLGSTDAASVFAILRKKKLNLRDGTASILEVESGSNDPVAYLMTLIALNGLGAGGQTPVVKLIFLQIFFGLLVGAVFALASVLLSTKTRLISEGLDTVFLVASVLLCYGLSSRLGGNAYLSVYIMGIIIGNRKIRGKRSLIPFFDGLTSLSQILIFFLLGLLTFPRQMPAIVPTALVIVVCITLVARPLAVFLLLLPLKCSLRQCLLIAWAGLRGASSSVFAITAVASGIGMKQDLFHIVFMVSVFSVAIQGTLLPWMARWLDMVDDTADVRKTFNDYEEDSDFALMKVEVFEGHEWAHRKIREIPMPTGSLAIKIKRGQQSIVTRGDTEIMAGDTVVWIAPGYTPEADEKLEEISIEKGNPWCNKRVAQLKLPPDMLIAMVLRGSETIIPDGNTLIRENDRVITYQ